MMVRATANMGVIHAALFPQLVALTQLAKIEGWHGTVAYRHAFNYLQTLYGAKVLEGLCSDLDIGCRFTFEGFEDSQVPTLKGPVLVVPNHQSTIDVVVIYRLMWHLRHTRVRWIMKSSLGGKWNPYGRAGREMGDAFVDRDGGDADLSKIEACGVQAARDDAAVVIFVEGTRFKEPVKDSGLRRVLPPKFRGFDRLCSASPKANILSVTLHWSGGADGLGFGRTFTDMEGLIGRELSVHAKLVSRAEVEPDRGGWLRREWVEKDERLAVLEETA